MMRRVFGDIVDHFRVPGIGSRSILRQPALRHSLLAATIVVAICIITTSRRQSGARAAVTINNSYPVTTVSAASYVGLPAPLATGSIAAAFGTQLATATQIATSLPLPTSLLTTRLSVNGTPAQLFFVSPNQINFVIPGGLLPGEAQVVVTVITPNGDEVISRGSIRVAETAPSLFAADASGVGAPAAQSGRVNQEGQFVFDPTPPFQPDPANPGRLIPAPIDVGTADRPAFLILYGTGIRKAPPGSVKAIIGGVETTAEYFGPAPGFVALDQVNLRLPIALRGRGMVDLTLVISGVSSNPITINLAGNTGQSLSITGFSLSSPALAGQTITIQGNGFSSNPTQNVVRFGPAQARVVSASSNQLTVIVPFGARTGQVTVQANQIEARSNEVFRVKTSISGIVQSTGQSGGTAISLPVPLNNVTVRLTGTNLSVRTNQQGTFVLSDVPSGVSLVEIDGATNGTSPPFPSVSLKMTARPDQDNQFQQPISLQQITGGSGAVGGMASFSTMRSESLLRSLILAGLGDLLTESAGAEPIASALRAKQQSGPQGRSAIITDRGVTLDVPIGASVRFPDGKTSGQVQMTVVERSRLPGISLPPGIYSSTIAQITPLGTKFTPGASLTFPNPDPLTLNPGSRVDLYRYDPPTGSFIRRGNGVVSADRMTVVSDGRVVDMASFWLVATGSNGTTVTGRVIDSAGLPVVGAKVTVNGRSSQSDQNGGFSLPDVSAVGSGTVQVEAVVQQQFGTPPRGISAATRAIVGGITSVGNITLSDTNQAGLVLSPFVLSLSATAAPTPVGVTLTQPAPAGGLVVRLSSDKASVASVPGSITIPAGQTTVSFNITRVGPGVATVQARATLNNSAIETVVFVSVAQPGPAVTAVSPRAAAPGAKITISGSGFSSVPDNQVVTFVRNNQMVAVADPFDNETIVAANGTVSLRVRVPKIAAGDISIVVGVIDDLSGTISEPSSPFGFSVLDSLIQPPRLTAALPSQGRPRDRITLNGTGFSTVSSENIVRFIQNGIMTEARVIQSSASSLSILVPTLGVTKGAASIVATRLDPSGAVSPDSNSIDFNVTADPLIPVTPQLVSVLNAATGAAAGRDGDRLTITGNSFGINYFDVTTGDLATTDPIVSVILFYQNGQFVNFVFPNGASGGTRLNSYIPSGLTTGPVSISVANYDLESGLTGSESRPLPFSITQGSTIRLDEQEPNDSPAQATRATIPGSFEGRIAKGDPGSLSVDLDNGSRTTLSDLFRLEVTGFVRSSILLTFSNTANLDLFLLQETEPGFYEVVASSTAISGNSESLIGLIPPGNYLIGIGAASGSGSYVLTLQANSGLTEIPLSELLQMMATPARRPVAVVPTSPSTP